MTTSTLVQKLWNYCNVLRDDGMSYGDYVEQLTYLLFLKMADERSRPPHNQPSPIPAAYAWPALLAKDGAMICSTTTATRWKRWAMKRARWR
jgi:type I restriction enzyme M protein